MASLPTPPVPNRILPHPLLLAPPAPLFLSALPPSIPLATMHLSLPWSPHLSAHFFQVRASRSGGRRITACRLSPTFGSCRLNDPGSISTTPRTHPVTAGPPVTQRTTIPIKLTMRTKIQKLIILIIMEPPTAPINWTQTRTIITTILLVKPVTITTVVKISPKIASRATEIRSVPQGLRTKAEPNPVPNHITHLNRPF